MSRAFIFLCYPRWRLPFLTLQFLASQCDPCDGFDTFMPSLTIAAPKVN
ncbi:hypothetical protein CKO_01527 [Citrobacter koseri ATCC BAA-895]|uniref:Uncharacterized protein n=1 Tax=Citrobacter koseri (strain ATCC BAA-895 / CDC 4225-83 / SGSC4696) TaxID=290338 RepID=A8AGP6_CITK8|nr:hypothetical protein CKO_01527 [Citrobacter koseri ATCC BAA-895]